MRRFRGLALVFLLTGCAHRGSLNVEVERQSSSGLDEHASVVARPGGIVADVQFRRVGKPTGPVRVSARRGEGDVVEIHIDYRPGRAKCVSARKYRVEVDGLDPGDYEVVVVRGDLTIATHEVAVPEGGAAPSEGHTVRRVSETGC